LWEDAPDSMMDALRLHDGVIGTAVEAHNGVLVKPRGEGDSQFAVFSSAVDAVLGSTQIQRRLAEVDWPTPRPLRVRASLHTGLAELELGDYYGSTVNRAARLRSIAHGGQTVLSGSTFELVQDHLPEGVSISDLGAHRLKDLTRPEKVFQLNLDGLDNRFPSLKSLDAVPNNLPVQLTEFIGRQHELANARTTLAETRLLTILAPGGAGKTRLAIQTAAELTSEFPDGVFFIDLAPIHAPDGIIQTASESLGIALSTEEDLQTQLLTYLASKNQLLVFDNFEHVAAGSGIVTEILSSCPRVKMIVTSRSKLNIKGETVMAVSGLETTWSTSEEAFTASGVRLFADASKRADASFSLSAEDLEPLAQILELVGGMPLGIELAAAWVDALQIGEIAEEIAKSLDFLESEMEGIPDRHRSVRAVFDYSWSMLDPDQRRMFSALSVFRGGFTREAGEAVAGTSMRHLANLVSKSLLVHNRESGRYTVHELLRQYAEESLREDAPLHETTVAAHKDFYAELGAHAEELMFSDQIQAIRLVEADLDNIRSAWLHSLGGGDGAAVRKFVFALWLLYEIRGWHQAAASLYGEALDALEPHSGDEATEIARAAAAALQAWFWAHLGQPEVGVDQATDAVAKLATLPDRSAQVYAITCQIACLTYLNRFEEAREVGIEGVRISEALGNEQLPALLKAWLGLSELQLGNIDTATTVYDESERVLSQLIEYWARAWNALGMAVIASMQSRPHDGIEILKRLVTGVKEIGYRRATQTGLQYLGDAQLSVDDFDAADASFVESLAMSEEMGQVVEKLGLLARVAQVRAKVGKIDEAVAILASVLGDPISSQSMLVDNISITEMTTTLLADLEQELDPDDYSAAYTRGNARTVEDTAKELLTT
ncbi:MAG: NB-ARC domain-containing protein, partial [Acidimicrobiia bacterium]